MKPYLSPLRLTLLFFISVAVFSFVFPPKGFWERKAIYDTLTDPQKRLPENALAGVGVADGLQLQLMATEPMLQNPTNIDVDEKGRVWVTEAYNYRPAINGNPTSAKGDRIVILEDKDGDGKLESSKIFYQGPELNAPLGIAVLGKRVIVSQSPYVWNFYDDNGDDVADRKEIMFQGIEGEQHDHGVHAFTFGPDGKLYFNFGNNGVTLKDKNGKVVLDQDGDEIGPAKYKQGMVFRCNVDGSQVECLGDNFRNPFEVAVDSYGTLWQSDNDDDGNKGTRINYVMPYGNYGYTDEMTGAGWSSGRTNMEDSIPYRHWHLNDPGVVPNILQTGAGSPTGIMVYEGNLLPQDFHHQPIHCDAGPNVVRAYPIVNSGAGYKASIINILKGDLDRWFRPADVCAAPDGSLIVADWYDPGVGGHQAGDQVKGRIYRVAPKGNDKYIVPKMDLSTVKGSIEALKNPNLAVRFHAVNALKNFGTEAVSSLEEMWKKDPDEAMKARAFWMLLQLSSADHDRYIKQAVKSRNPQLRMLALRGSKLLGKDMVPVVKSLKKDADPQVRRECMLALHHNKSSEAPALWTDLAMQYDGKDRWYLEALGIGADGQWDAYFKAYIQKVKDPIQVVSGRDIVWRARTPLATSYLAKLAMDEQVLLKDRLRYFRAFDFNQGNESTALLLQMIAQNNGKDKTIDRIIFNSLNDAAVKSSPVALKALKKVMRDVYGSKDYIDLVNRYILSEEQGPLLELAVSKSNNDIIRAATRTLLSNYGSAEILNIVNGSDTAKARGMLLALSGVGSKISVDIIQQYLLNERKEMSLRKFAATRIGRSGEGEKRVLSILKAGIVPEEFIPDVVASVSGAWQKAVRLEAASYLPKKKEEVVQVKPQLTLESLLPVKAYETNGKIVFQSNCATCHKIGKEGYDFGPALTTIGDKYDRDGMWKAIVKPSEGISFGYEGWNIQLNDGSVYSGIISSRTKTEIELRMPGGMVQKIRSSTIKRMDQMKSSMMPEGLHESLSIQEMADLMVFLEQLKK
ncbi:MAG: PVC-type heme-binding CxxCH protein [Chitinophagia bacterium]